MTDNKYKEELEDIGKKIKERRKGKGWTLNELAERAGCSESYIFKIEKGNRIPSLTMLMDIARAFNIKLETLIRG